MVSQEHLDEWRPCFNTEALLLHPLGAIVSTFTLMKPDHFADRDILCNTLSSLSSIQDGMICIMIKSIHQKTTILPKSF
jgi:hypothetical protein